jgi:hypothetical protein
MTQKQLKYILGLFLLIVFFMSCKKDTSMYCIANAGKETSFTVMLDDFDTIRINDMFEVHLKQDSFYSIEISGYEAMINAVSFNINNANLSLNNNMKCRWTKPQKNKVKLLITYQNINEIILEKTCEIRCVNPISGYKTGFVLKDKLQDIHLELDLDHFYFWNQSPCGGEIVLEGRADKFMFWSTALIRVDASKLNCLNVIMETNSRADSYVSATDTLDCRIRHLGNVYYYGNPTEIILKREGEGQLFKAD